MRPTLHFDTRWIGEHGIGRFANELFSRLPGAVALSVPGAKLSLLDPINCTRAAMRLRNGIYMTPGFNPPLRSAVPVVMTLHDLIHLKVPSESTPVRRLYYRSVVAPGARRAFKVLTGSEFARKQILDWLDLPPDRVQVVGYGVSPAFTPQGPREARAEPYFLHVGRRASHKNIPRLLQAYAESRSRADVRFVFTGTADRDTLVQIETLGLGARVDFAGSLSDSQLAAMYRGAVALVFPSLHEGFGLPIVEAMACGTPVITSATTATAEVAADNCALLVDPLSVDALTSALDKVLHDQQLRTVLAERGLQRSLEFRWECVTQRVCKAIGVQ